MASKKELKELKLTDVKDEVEKYKNVEIYQFENGSTITFAPLFSPSKVKNLVTELHERFGSANEKGIDLQPIITEYVHFLAIKYFTSLGSQISDNLENQLDELEFLIDGGYFDEIVNEVFSKKEIAKIWTQLGNRIGEIEVHAKLNKQVLDTVASLEMENKDLFEQIKNFTSESK
ncbi:hypothetical protein [Bacillus velezensis]|uniref:hypothetical protein n=1 Tax=Bacillus velezensis TaxID=492670 RepID=UPI00288B68A7|nr:hypothetical protein [Bacillus velezensis]WNJ14006.1 hypothetical protein RJY17_01630 [Bacillus velezensis]